MQNIGEGKLNKEERTTEQGRSSLEDYCEGLLNSVRWTRSGIKSVADSSEVASFHTAPECSREMYALARNANPGDRLSSVAGPGPKTQEYFDALLNPVRWGHPFARKNRDGTSEDDYEWESVDSFSMKRESMRNVMAIEKGRKGCGDANRLVEGEEM